MGMMEERKRPRYGISSFKGGDVIRCVHSDSPALYEAGDIYLVENKPFIDCPVSFLKEQKVRMIGSFASWELIPYDESWDLKEWE